MTLSVLKWTALAACPLALLAINPAYSQDQRHEKLKSYGSRVGDRDDQAKLNLKRRVNARLNTRIDSRLDNRLDRFVEPNTDTKSAYSPQMDDGTKEKP